MASFSKAISKELFDNILPTFGNARVSLPTWDNGQKMFIVNEYESANGNRYYTGIRFCDRVVIVERVGLYHNWTYIDGIELYAFNGEKLELVQKRTYEKVYRKESFVRQESEVMIEEYMNGMLKMTRSSLPAEVVKNQARDLVEGCYKSFLDMDYNIRLTKILPAINTER